MSSHYCNGKLQNIVTRDYMGLQNRNLNFRARNFQPGVGDRTDFQNQNHDLRFNQEFWDVCSRWANNMYHNFDRYSLYEQGRLIINWFGDVGTVACHRSTSSHNRGRGFDLAQIRFTNNYIMDCNWSPQASMLHQRRYLGVAANLRRYFGTVLTAWYNSAHRDHIHFDNYSRPVGVINTRMRSDTTLIQAACNLLNNESLVIDGAWGNNTDAAYKRLVKAMGLHCRDPKSNVNDAQRLCFYIMRNAIANKGTPEIKASC